MGWRDELRPASFRGVGFEALELSGESGRRVVADECPETEELPPTADLGRKRPSFRLRGFVVGNDYLDRKERLLNALNAYGPGDLVHPWRGQLRVQVRDVSHKHDLQHGVCVVEFDCVDAGGVAAPIVEVVADQRAAAKAVIAREKADPALLDAMGRGYELIGAGDVFDTVFVVPEFELLERVLAVTGWLGNGDITDHIAAYEDMRRLLDYVRSAAAAVWVGTGTSSDDAIAAAVVDFQDSLRLLCAVRATELAAAMRFVSADAAEETMAEVAGVLADRTELVVDRDLFMALTDLRASMVDALTQAASRLPRERTIIVAASTPTIVIAFDAYGGKRLEQREAELIRRNNIGAAGFVSGPVKVLSR